MTKSVFLGLPAHGLFVLSLLGLAGCYAKVEVSDSSAEKAIAIDLVEPPCAEPGSAAGYIEGNGFGALNVTVTVGGIEAEVLAATGKDASFVVPEELSPGPIEVVVTNPGGRIATINWVVCGFDCNGIDCTSDNECVEDGTCDPAAGMCIDGGNQPADTACGNGDVCDGQGNCVECNDAGQCIEDGNDCTAASCVDGACGQSDLPDGTMCDLLSVDDGVCMSGICAAAPDCTDAADCDDGNECTTNGCDENLICTATPNTDASCAGGTGVCDADGACVSFCAGVDCDDGNECTDDSCVASSGGPTCVNAPNDSNSCNTCGGSTCVCSAGICEAVGGPDVDPPVLTDFDFDPKSVDVSTQSQDVACTMTVTDIGSGVDYAECTFYGPEGQFQQCAAFSPSSGDRANGVWSCTVTIPQGAAPAIWEARVVTADFIRNTSSIRGPDLQAMGWPSELDVTSAGPDVDPPVLTDFDFDPKSVDVSTQSQDVACTMTVTDIGSGVDYAECTFYGPEGQFQQCAAFSPSSGDRANGVWSCTVTIPQGAAPAIWEARVVTADFIRNTSSIRGPDLQAMGWPSELNVTSAGPDVDPPVLTDFDFDPKSVDVSTQSQDVACTMTVTDIGSGVDYAECTFYGPEGQFQQCAAFSPSSGDRANGVWSCTVTIPQGAAPAIWEARVVTADFIRNTSSIRGPDLQAMGWPSELDVTYGGGSLTP